MGIQDRDYYWEHRNKQERAKSRKKSWSSAIARWKTYPLWVRYAALTGIGYWLMQAVKLIRWATS
jgi:hypothetical protein